LSAAILYVAIVVIWIGVLVPRWLRHDNTQDGHGRLRRFPRHRDTGDQVDNAEPGTVQDSSAIPGVPGPPEGPGPGELDGVVAATEADFGAYPSAPEVEAEAAPAYEPATEVPPVPSYGWPAEEYPRQDGDGETLWAEYGTQPRDEPSAYQRDKGATRSRDLRPGVGGARPRGPHGGERPGRPQGGGPPSPHAGARSGPQRAGHQARLIMARRRMLWMLVVLTMLSLALAYVRLAGWWVVIPPTIMLLGYLMLLREAARADAELRQRMAAAQAAAHARRDAAAKRMAGAGHATPAGAGPADERFAPARPAHQPLPPAEVIDISARVGDQLYDQYADAKLRAVGD
jgi:hypothetical protein